VKKEIRKDGGEKNKDASTYVAKMQQQQANKTSMNPSVRF
jgi:hypothetical protein